ncbi:MAG: hypothetical protein AB4042_16285 [Leptolyngbyaceae cyanobacterium]
MDWLRLQKALSVEAERGFNDLIGNQYRFSEFISLQIEQPPANLDPEQQHQWQQRASAFSSYSQLSFAERQHLVADTRRLIYQSKRSLAEGTQNAERSPSKLKTQNSKLKTQNSKLKTQNSPPPPPPPNPPHKNTPP